MERQKIYLSSLKERMDTTYTMACQLLSHNFCLRYFRRKCRRRGFRHFNWPYWSSIFVVNIPIDRWRTGPLKWTVLSPIGARMGPFRFSLRPMSFVTVLTYFFFFFLTYLISWQNPRVSQYIDWTKNETKSRHRRRLSSSFLSELHPISIIDSFRFVSFSPIWFSLRYSANTKGWKYRHYSSSYHLLGVEQLPISHVSNSYFLPFNSKIILIEHGNQLG